MARKLAVKVDNANAGAIILFAIADVITVLFVKINKIALIYFQYSPNSNG